MSSVFCFGHFGLRFALIKILTLHMRHKYYARFLKNSAPMGQHLIV